MKSYSTIRISKWLFIPLLIILTIAVGCTPSPPDPAPTPISTNTSEPLPTPLPPPAPSLDQPDGVTLDAGKQIPIKATSEGAVKFKWFLSGDGSISSESGPAVIYTAPDGEGGLALISVTAYNAGGINSPTTTLTININPGEVTLVAFEFDTPQDGDTLKPNQKTDCGGTYKLSFGNDATSVYMWLLVRDDDGNYYLQSPPVTFETDGTWTTKIKPGRNITKIFAIQVTEDGNEFFLEKVENNEFDGFMNLPKGSKIIESINITT